MASRVENSGVGTAIGSGGPISGLTGGELISGSADPAHLIASGDAGRVEQQQAPFGLSQPHSHMVGIAGSSAQAIRIGAVAGDTSTMTSITVVTRHGPESRLNDPSGGSGSYLINFPRITYGPCRHFIGGTGNPGHLTPQKRPQ